ncbi:MAG: ZPR1 zinc finger domain-containing protein [Candidatus Thalassarchaeaceae archaeon]|nr:ZPR1 zinc finger domain-containing protein [Candidatus Thalassarchaeaceae archaeon]
MESRLEQDCPICFSEATLKMIAHSSEIPYFGEHTQITMICEGCGWKVTDFIPADGKKPGAWSLTIDSEEHMSTRVVRSSSCTVRITELGLEVSPGGSSTGYVSNIEGVLKRFEDAVGTIKRQSERDQEDPGIITRCNEMLSLINSVRTGSYPVTLELLDPVGHSQILHEDAVSRDIASEEAESLDPGPVYPVFDAADLV